MDRIHSDRNRIIIKLKKAIWLYFFLLLFEGALRKWFLPFLASPLLIIRDPLAIWILFQVIHYKIIPFNKYIFLMTIVALISFFATLVFGHQNFLVAFYGIRIFLIHFPLMFVIGKVFTQEDILGIGKWMVIFSIPMSLLIIIQFYSPQSAWVNRGVGGDMAGAGFGGAMGYFRPPGTFSFTSGNSLFWGLLAPFVCYFWMAKIKINRFLLLTATAALLIAIPISISRTILFEVALTFVFSMIVLMRNPKNIYKAFMLIGCVCILAVVLSQISVFQTSIEVFTERFTSANETEGGLDGVFIDRFLGGMVGAITQPNEIPFFGYGIGMGTNVGAVLMTGKSTFLIAEVEWGRLIGEMGILLGLFVIVIRTVFVLNITIKAYQKMITGQILSWLLVSFGMLTILQGQWAQPTSLGFSTLIGGLILASLKKRQQFIKKR